MQFGKLKLIGTVALLGNTIVLADPHIGYEEALNKQGIFVPRFQLGEELAELRQLAKIKGKFELAIVNGDIKHEFGEISSQEWKDTIRFLDALSKLASRTILVRGNHDNVLEPIAARKGIEIVDHFLIDDVYITHGHSLPKGRLPIKAKTVLIAHIHPALSLREGQRVERYKCWLVGSWRRKQLIVQPSFFTIMEGSDVLKEQDLSPFLQDIRLGSFRAIAVGKKRLYEFGKLGKIGLY